MNLSQTAGSRQKGWRTMHNNRTDVCPTCLVELEDSDLSHEGQLFCSTVCAATWVAEQRYSLDEFDRYLWRQPPYKVPEDWKVKRKVREARRRWEAS